MENRFGIKDFFLFLLMIILIIVVLLAMKQFDRQWDQVLAIKNSLAEQQQSLHDLQEKISRGGVALSGSTTAPSTQQADDPFTRIRAARAMPGYSKGDWLVDAFGNGLAKLTPLLSGDAYASEVQDMVLESLVQRDPMSLAWQPLLSTGWKVQDNMATYQQYAAQQKAAGKSDDDIKKDANAPIPISVVFNMRDGVTFSDGQPLTAEDVIFTFNFIMDPKIAAPRDRAYMEKIRKVVKTGPAEVTVYFNEPYYDPVELAGGFAILPQHFYSKFTPEQFNQSVGLLMGSGPYRMEDPEAWKPGQLVQVVRNENYWGVQPAFDRIVWREITNDVAHNTAFRNGDIDLISLPPEQYRTMLKDQALLDRTQHMEYFSPRGGYRYVAWNEKNKDGAPTRFADKRVRQALTMLVDRQRMVEQIMLGYAQPATGPFSPLSKQYNPAVKAWPFDSQRALQLLRDAGFKDKNSDGLLLGPDGQPFKFKLTYPSGSGNYEKMVLFLKDSYARAGIELDPDPHEWSAFTEKLKNKDFDAISLGWTAGTETDIFQMFHSSQMVTGGDDFMSYKNPELDQTIEQARTTLDTEKRMALWQHAHEILHEDQPYMFLWFGKSLLFADKRLENLQLTNLGLNPRVEWFVPRGRQRWEK